MTRLNFETRGFRHTAKHVSPALSGAAFKSAISVWVDDVNRRDAERTAKREAAKAKASQERGGIKYPRERVIQAKLLYKYGPMSFADVARKLSVPEGTVACWLNGQTRKKCEPTAAEISAFLSSL